MKYIKTFENLNLKRYLAYKMGMREDGNFIVLEVLHQSKTQYLVKRLYVASYNTYTGDVNIHEYSNQDEFNFNFAETGNRIKYQSDSLQDVLDTLPTLYSAIKYNL